MSAWFGSSALGAFDQLVAKATSESLPAGEEDIVTELEICDEIRGKKIPAKDAMRSIKRRLGNSNPNVQISCLHLVETCLKNGGDHFLLELGSREFVDNMVSLLRQSGNRDVKNAILKTVQLFGLASKAKPQFYYAEQVLNELRAEGFEFPAAQEMASSFIDSSAPPEWGDSDVCMRCRTPFSFTNRKHHCRNCGNTFDQDCSSKTLALPHLGITTPVRVCDTCYTKLSSKKGPPAVDVPPSTSASVTSRSHNVAPPAYDNEDEDLRRALELSLQDSAPAPAPVQSTPNGHKVPQNEEEEDAALRAAIEASLADARAQEPVALPPATREPSKEQVSAYHKLELDPHDAENINLFAAQVERLKMAPPGAVLREPQVQELHEKIGSIRPQLMRCLGDAMSRYDKLTDMHSKIGTAIRYYDGLLEERLSSAYMRTRIAPEQYPTTGSQGMEPWQQQQKVDSMPPTQVSDDARARLSTMDTSFYRSRQTGPPSQDPATTQHQYYERSQPPQGSGMLQPQYHTQGQPSYITQEQSPYPTQPHYQAQPSHHTQEQQRQVPEDSLIEL